LAAAGRGTTPQLQVKGQQTQDERLYLKVSSKIPTFRAFQLTAFSLVLPTCESNIKVNLSPCLTLFPRYMEDHRKAAVYQSTLLCRTHHARKAQRHYTTICELLAHFRKAKCLKRCAHKSEASVLRWTSTRRTTERGAHGRHCPKAKVKCL
jgi:hypothetical protein